MSTTAVAGVVARIEHRHDDLGADDTYHEWVHVGDAEWRAKDGRRAHGWYRWLRYCCNNTRCHAVAWVSREALDQYATELIDEAL